MSEQVNNPYSAVVNPKRMRTVHLQQFKEADQRFAMLTSYDAMTAEIFDAAGVEVLLVGDSSANVVLGQDSTLSITVDQMITLASAVVRGASRALVLVDLPFGSFEVSAEQAVATSVRIMKETGAHGVKIEGGSERADLVRAVVNAGIPVMAHIGFTPQAEHALGGYRVQGRGDAAAKLRSDAQAMETAGAFSVLMEMVPSEIATEIDSVLRVPTVGIGAGAGTTGQVLVWQDMLGLSDRRVPRFVKKYADLRSVITEAVTNYHQDVVQGRFPEAQHGFE